MIDGIKSLYSWNYAKSVVYMLQSTEYQAVPYLKWYWRTWDFGTIMKRRVLDPTKVARILLTALRLGMLIQIAISFAVIGYWWKNKTSGLLPLGISLLVSYPVIWAHIMIIPLALGRIFVLKPREAYLRRSTTALLRNHPAQRIAVAGSYGKTTMKELLQTILSEGKKVAYTPGNRNTPGAHYQFVKGLAGDEDVIIFELGEGRPGDVAHFVDTLRPHYGVVTGLAPAHLDHYRSVTAAGKDIMQLASGLDPKNVYVNGESPELTNFIKKEHNIYSISGVDGWNVSGIKIGFDGTRFVMTKGKESMRVHSGLLGEHQVGPIAAVSAISKRLGLSTKNIVSGISKTVSFEHRMEPKIISGAWVLDDTYNGNIEGVRAGIELLRSLPATKRRIYVSPGLVDQGRQTSKVHARMGAMLSKGVDEVVLMQNSVTEYIVKGLEQNHFKGQLRIVDNPLEFYTNLAHFVAAGDVVLMQNDWTDNYN